MSKNKFVCVHGHFYQPPRENPWLNEVEIQDSAYPFHDWNHRITAQCYARNAASRILDHEGRIVDIVNNYSYISFNYGPTLLEWMEKNQPEAYQVILDADKESQKRFSGHGSAIAQAYNHMIMPLANDRDKETQIIWGIKDFEARFKRKPEGMWCGETAMDTPTLELLAKHGIKFTILSPYQAKNIRKIGEEAWNDVTNARVDPRRAYSCNLPSGANISLFFYDGPVSMGIAFEHLLDDGTKFCNRLLGCLSDNNEPELVNIATDGESYGHHHHFGEMALSYCLHNIEKCADAKVTIYGEFLEKFPPQYEAQIIEASSWSCSHGVERWRSDCGCNAGTPNYNQKWRGPLREAFDWVRDQLIPLFEKELKPYVKDVWKIRNEYIELIRNRDKAYVKTFLKRFIKKELQSDDYTKILKLLEMQYHAMLMYTSCGWFFDEVTGIESMQDILYAARAIQLAKDVTGNDFEPEFIKLLEKAPSNLPEVGNAAKAYQKIAQPAVMDLLRVGAHYAVSSIFTQYPEVLDLYSYTASSEVYDIYKAGKYTLAVGKAHICSKITWEEQKVCFAVLHLGEHQLFGGIREFQGDEAFNTMHTETQNAFEKGNIQEILLLMDKHYGTHSYSFWHLFRDDQKKIVTQLLENDLLGIESMYRQMYDSHYYIIQTINELSMPLPNHLKVTGEFVINQRIRKVFELEKVDMKEFKNLQHDILKLKIELDKETLNFLASVKAAEVLKRFANSHNELGLLQHAIDLVKVSYGIGLDPDFWKIRNQAFLIKVKHYQNFRQAAEKEINAKNWISKFDELLAILNLKIDVTEVPGQVNKLEPAIN